MPVHRYIHTCTCMGLPVGPKYIVHRHLDPLETRCHQMCLQFFTALSMWRGGQRTRRRNEVFEAGMWRGGGLGVLQRSVFHRAVVGSCLSIRLTFGWLGMKEWIVIVVPI